MPKIVKLFTVLTLVGGAHASAQVATNRDSATFVVNELQDATDSQNNTNMIIRQGFVGHVDAGSAFTHAVRMDRATRFVVKGYCDQNCSDLDMKLLDRNGGILLADNAVDDTPELAFRLNELRGIPYSVRVTMHTCETNLCYYSVGVFSR